MAHSKARLFLARTRSGETWTTYSNSSLGEHPLPGHDHCSNTKSILPSTGILLKYHKPQSPDPVQSPCLMISYSFLRDFLINILCIVTVCVIATWFWRRTKLAVNLAASICVIIFGIVTFGAAKIWHISLVMFCICGIIPWQESELLLGFVAAGMLGAIFFLIKDGVRRR